MNQPSKTLRASLAEMATRIESGKRPKGGVGTILDGVWSLGGEHVANTGELNLAKGKFVPHDFFNRMKKGVVTPGDILIIKDGATTGRVARVPDPMPFLSASINEHLFLVRVDESKCLQDFVYYYLRSRPGQSEIMSDFRGAAQGGIGRTFAEKVLIPLSPLEEQRRIVDILNRAASIERLRSSASMQLRALIPALFIKMFGDPIKNPMGWEKIPLGKTTTLVQYGTSKKASETREGLPVLRMGNVTIAGHLDCSDLKYIELAPKEVEKYRLQPGDLLFNRTNSMDLVGKTGVWDGRFEAVPASYFIQVRFDPQIVAPVYVGAFMNTPQLKRHLFQMAKGAIGQANINAKELKNIPIPLPPLDLQQRYAELITKMHNMMALLEGSADEAHALSQALMAQLFNPAGPMESEVSARPEQAVE